MIICLVLIVVGIFNMYSTVKIREALLNEVPNMLEKVLFEESYCTDEYKVPMFTH